MAKAWELAEICEVEESVLSATYPTSTSSSTCTISSSSKPGKTGSQKTGSCRRVSHRCWSPLGNERSEVSSPKCVSEIANTLKRCEATTIYPLWVIASPNHPYLKPILNEHAV